MAKQDDRHGRSILPIPDVRKPALTAFDANTGTLVRSYDVVDGADSAFVGGGMM